MKEFVCIVCPRGCHLKIDDSNNVTGNFCPRGAKYAVQESTNPTRVVTSTVRLANSIYPRVPVKTDKPIPKDKIFDVMKEINKITMIAPVKIGDIALENVLGLDVNIVITKDIKF